MTNSRELLEALPVAVYTTDAAGRLTFFNQAAVDLWGRRPELGADEWCGSWRLYWADGRPLPHDECPMALTLKQGRPVRGMEAIAERPDGSRVRFIPYPSPLHDESGRLIGAVNLLMDVTERYNAELSSARLGAIVVSSDDAIVSKTLDGIVTSWNDGARNIFGYDESEMIGHSIKRIIPPHLHGEEDEILARLRRGEHIRHYETVRLTKDRRLVNISATVSPLRDRFGTVVGASKVARDITERKQADELQRLLIDELNHRVKNTLATIQAIASQSLGRSRSPQDFVTSFSGRVQALARAHNMLTEAKMQGAQIDDLIREHVLLGDADRRISCSGPTLVLDAQAALHLALVLHELATNARKYGALSTPHGRLALSWEVRRNGEQVLRLDWKESGGPRVGVPKERGFGSVLIEKTLQGHGGAVEIRFEPEGVSGHITMPLREIHPTIGTMAAAAHTAQQGDLAQAASQSRSRRIIVIEDEPLVAMDLETRLIEAGWTVVGVAGTLEQARKLVANAECEAALLDVNLAGRPVDELAAVLRRRKIPFAFATGYGRSALPAGFREGPVLTKPFSSEQLSAVVSTLVARDERVVPLRQKTPR
ncbi:MAG: PAS domain S-box protein [Alphaproteobacteria bacterium]|nr:PAS domain S-box protein [Alphaproteobacteria bacterium]